MWAFAGVSVVNAVPSWLGSTMAVDIKIEVSIEEGLGQHSSLTREIVEYFKKRFGVPELRVIVRSPIPPGSGLKSSSAVAVALIEAIRQRYGLRDIDTPRLASELSIRAGVSVTGAYDDATASYHGGVSFTDNMKRELIDLRSPPDDISVVILVRGGRGRIDPEPLRRFRDVFREIFETALRGDIITAMRLNGVLVAQILGYDLDPIRRALQLGALASGVTGNGPSIFAVTRRGDEGPIIDLFSKIGETIVAEPAEIERL